MSDAERIASILASWQEEQDKGEDVDEEAILSAHPDLADQLREKFAGLKMLGATRAGTRGSLFRTRLRELPLGRYTDFRPAGEGGMGIVYWAIDTDLNREVAFKVIRPGVGEGDTTTPEAPVELTAPAKDTPASQAFETLKQRFLQEAWVTGGLSHPGIVPVYELGETPEGVPYYTMRFVKGERTLADAMEEATGKDVEERLKLLEPFLKVCDTLSYAHAKGVIHRDLKPDNIALGEFGEVVVIDWGLAKLQDRPDVAHERWQDRIQEYREATDLRTVASAMGTPGYMAPEAARGQADQMDARSDVYSLGAMLFQILTGRLPFEFTTFGELIMKLLKEKAPRAADVTEGVPTALSDLCARCLGGDADQRPQDADAVSRAVRDWQAHSTVEREVETLIRDATSALATARKREGEARIEELDRVVASCSRSLTLRPDHQPALDLQSEVAGLREQGVKERESTERRRVLLRGGVAVGVMVVAAAIVVGWVLNERRKEADQLRGLADVAAERAIAERDAKADALTRAIGMRLAGHSTLVLEESRDLALLLAIEAAKHDGGPLATNALLEALEAHDPHHLRSLAVPGVDLHLEGVSADGRVVVTQLFDWETYRYRGWDLDSGAVLWDLERGLNTHVGPRGEVALVFTATGGAEVVATSDGRCVSVLEDLRGPEGCWFSPDGRLVVSVDEEEGAGVWETETGRHIAWLEGAGLIYSDLVVFSADGGRVLTRHHNRPKAAAPAPVRFWSTKDGRLLGELGGVEGATTQAAFGPGGRRALLKQRDEATLWDVDESAERWRITGPEAEGRVAAFSPDGARIATATRMGTVRLWDAESGSVVATLEGLQVQVRDLEFGPLSRVLAIARGDGRVELREARSGAHLETLRAQKGAVAGLLFSPDGENLITSDGDGAVRTWTVSPGKAYPRAIGPEGAVGSVLLGPGGEHVLVQDPSGTARVFDAASGDVVASYDVPEGVAISQLLPGGRAIGVASARSTIYLLDTTTGEEIVSFPVVGGGPDWVPVRCTEAALLLGGRFLAARLHLRSVEAPEDWQNEPFLWDTTTGRAPMSGGTTIAASPAGNRIVFGDQVYDLETLDPICDLVAHDDYAHVIGFGPGGQRIAAVGEDNSVRLHGAETGIEELTMHGHRDWVPVVVFAPDGKRLLSGSEDGSARIWELATGRELAVLSGHRGPVGDGSFDAAGDRVLTVCPADGTIRVWDARTRLGEEVAVLDREGFTPEAARFTKDGRAVTVLGRQGSNRTRRRVFAWLLDPISDALAERPRVLTFEERAQYLPEEVPDAERRARDVARQASQRVARLRQEHLLRDRLLARIENDPTLAPDEREASLVAARLLKDDHYALEEASWEVVRSSGATNDAYEVALARVRRACELDPESEFYPTTLGFALYRTGAFAEALDVLVRAARNREGNGLAYIALAEALCHARLRRAEEARAAIDRAYETAETLRRLDGTEPEVLCEEVADVIEGTLEDPELAERARTLPAHEEATRRRAAEAERRARQAARAKEPYIGVNADRQSLRIPGGFAITGALEGTPAAAAGLRAGDLIVGLGEAVVTDHVTYRVALLRFAPGDEVTLTVKRGEEVVSIAVTLARRGDFDAER